MNKQQKNNKQTTTIQNDNKQTIQSIHANRVNPLGPHGKECKLSCCGHGQLQEQHQQQPAPINKHQPAPINKQQQQQQPTATNNNKQIRSTITTINNNKKQPTNKEYQQ